jgi:chromosome segregation ATPase
MPRTALIGEGQWFELADALAAAGEGPTVKGLHAAAKERFGTAASFTTIQRILESWRRMGGAERAQDLPPLALDLVLKAFTPLYQQLRAESRNELEPRVLAAEQAAEEARLHAQALEAELPQLENERLHLRAQLQVSGERERELTGALASALTQVAELKSVLEIATQTHQQQLAAAQAQLREQEARQLAERAHAHERHQRALSDLREREQVEREALEQRHRVALDRVHEEIVPLREALQVAQAARSAFGAQREELEKHLRAKVSELTALQERNDVLARDLQLAQSKAQRFEQAAATARGANAQMAAAYQQRIDELQGALDTLAHGQAAMQAQFEQLLDRISKRRLSSGRTPG